MTTIFEAFDAVLALGAAPARAGQVAAMRAAFEARTGAFAPEDPWFDARSGAFWDDTVTGGFAAEVASELDTGAQAWAPRFARAHRGLFVMVEGSGARGAPVVRDLWSGAELVVHDIDPATRDALGAVAAPFDARLVGSDEPARVGMLPGAVFHPAEAAGPIAEVIAEARKRALTTRETLDALLRMERGFRASARVKAAYSYRASKLIERASGAIDVGRAVRK